MGTARLAWQCIGLALSWEQNQFPGETLEASIGRAVWPHHLQSCAGRGSDVTQTCRLPATIARRCGPLTPQSSCLDTPALRLFMGAGLSIQAALQWGRLDRCSLESMDDRW
jgi:hypothetical protein